MYSTLHTHACEVTAKTLGGFPHRQIEENKEGQVQLMGGLTQHVGTKKTETPAVYSPTGYL